MLFRKTAGHWRHRVLAVRYGADPVLHALAPLGLAAARGTALVVDLDEEVPSYPGSTSLANLVVSHPRRNDLRPVRSGVAVLSNGLVSPQEAGQVIEALVAGWPAVVFRMGASHCLPPAFVETPVVPVTPLWPGFLHPRAIGPSVYQAVFNGPPPRLRGWCCRPWADPISSACSWAWRFLLGAG